MAGEGLSLDWDRWVNKRALLRHTVSPRGDVTRIFGFQRNSRRLVVLLLPARTPAVLGVAGADESALDTVLAYTPVSNSVQYPDPKISYTLVLSRRTSSSFCDKSGTQS